MSGPGDQTSAAEGRGHGHLRASHADRELAIEVLKAAFVQGRLGKDEFDLRIGRAFAARTKVSPDERQASRTWPGPGRGSGRSTISRTSGPPNRLKRTAFITHSDADPRCCRCCAYDSLPASREDALYPRRGWSAEGNGVTLPCITLVGRRRDGRAWR